ncbi:MAG: hypothetical protein NDJ89_09375 [Oligoflexia bacterium]|nr:hypothetical protein [Oligoflexia bacterium]
MSATHDKTQKATFVYTNLYQLYRKGKEAAQSSAPVEAETAPFVARPAGMGGKVLKADNLRAAAQPQVEAYNPPSFISPAQKAAPSPVGRRVERPDYLAPRRNEAVESLKENLKTLNDLHARLRFMLQELEELVK